MLVVVHHRNIQFFFQTAFDFKAFWSFDVFEVDTAEGGSDSLYGCNEFFRVFFIDFDIEYVNAGIDFEEQPFTFHYRFATQCAYVT